MPKHTRGDIDVVVGHALIIGCIDIAHVHQSIAHLVLPAIDEGVDNASNGLVAHDMCMHGYPVSISLARHVGQFIFLPVGQTLMTIGIERLHKSRAAFHRAVYKDFYPVGFYAGGSIFLGITGLGQSLVHIHPTFNLVSQTQHEVQVSGLVQLLGSLIEIGVIEIVTPTVDIHRITLRQYLLLDFCHVRLGHVNRKEVVIVHEGPYISAGLFLQKAGRRTVGTHHYLASAHF